ncbi:MAG: DUF116 domain-containing protein [Candidatus Thermoplasmatota archaeon]|nr:DUF116 domain-containing protein [Candidatus Thermoplasmatota archaeon]
MKEIISKAMSSGLDFSQKGVLKSFLYRMDIDEETYDRVYVNLKNNALKEKVAKAPFEDRIVLLPQCLRDPEDCEAELGEHGYECNHCGRCEIDKIKSKADELGYRGCYVTPGGSMAKNLLKEKEPGAVIAVACHPELVEGIEASHVFNIPVHAVPLLKAGCVNTEVDLDEVKDALQMRTG